MFNLNYSHSDSELKLRNLPTSLPPVKVLGVFHIADLLQA